MTDEGTLWDMEERFWTEGADSARTVTAKGAVFVFPYPVASFRAISSGGKARSRSAGVPLVERSGALPGKRMWPSSPITSPRNVTTRRFTRPFARRPISTTPAAGCGSCTSKHRRPDPAPFQVSPRIRRLKWPRTATVVYPQVWKFA